jgi:hypothetical protein
VFCDVPAAVIFNYMSKCSKCDKESKITYKGDDYCWDHFDEVTKPKTPTYTNEQIQEMYDELVRNGGVICYDGI